MSIKKTRVHLRRQTWVAKKGEVARGWNHIDATDIPLGRLAAEVATVLMGKHRPEYTPHVDTGEFVIVTNASQIKLTGNKSTQSLRMRYSGYPGGLKAQSLGTIREDHPDRLLSEAVRRMLPKNRLGRQMLKKLKVYAGTDHPHAGVNATEMKMPG
ncbi:MAG: 50S ribosomal protein L13 [Phycisphaerales bacterium]